MAANVRYYVIDKNIPGLETEEAVAKVVDSAKHIVVRGVALVPRMQLALEPAGGAAPTERKRKEPPLPDEAVLQSVTGLYADGKGRSKRVAREALPDIGTDKVDGCIDWMAHTGRLSVAGKTYTIVKE